MTVRQSRAEFDEKVGRERYRRSLSFDKICVTLSVIIYHIFNHYSDYLEDMRERKVETNSEAQKLIDEIQKFTTSYMNTIQSHCDKLIEKVQKNRALKMINKRLIFMLLFYVFIVIEFFLVKYI